MFSQSTKNKRMRARASNVCGNVHSYYDSKLKYSRKSSSKTFIRNVLNSKTTKMQNLCNLSRTWKSFCLVVFVVPVVVVIVVVIRKNPNVHSNYWKPGRRNKNDNKHQQTTQRRKNVKTEKEIWRLVMFVVLNAFLFVYAVMVRFLFASSNHFQKPWKIHLFNPVMSSLLLLLLLFFCLF